jgi:hypothetical protein
MFPKGSRKWRLATLPRSEIACERGWRRTDPACLSGLLASYRLAAALQ